MLSWVLGSNILQFLKIGIHPTYIKILQNIDRDASARVHLDKHTSESFPIERGVRQGNPISPKLVTAAIEQVFQKSNLQTGSEIYGENLTDLHFADDVALCTKVQPDTKNCLYQSLMQFISMAMRRLYGPSSLGDGSLYSHMYIYITFNGFYLDS